MRQQQRQLAVLPAAVYYCPAVLLLALGISLFSWSAPVSAAPAPSTPVRVAFLTDCTMYSNWQSIGMQFSFKMSGQPGSVIRVACCTDEEKKTYDASLLASVETHIAPSMAVNPKNGDHYAAYNKPYAVIDWLDHVVPKEEYVLVLDSDMILRRPFLVEQMGPSKGWAIGARYTYMIGVNNELADRHIPQVPKRNDTFAGPLGRRADQVGGFFFIHRDDLKRMSHDWLKFSEDVRFDDQAYRLSGDVYAVKPGDKPWISEMYGYAFAAAKADVWHKWDKFSMVYPEYEPRDGIPKLLHYGLLFEVGNYSFDKHWHYDFDVTKCPPWDLKDPKRRTAGLFAPPPRPSSLPKQEFIKMYKDLIAIETVATMNAGFCDYHLSHCPPSEQLVEVCREAISLYNEAVEAIKAAEAVYDCQDFHPKCKEWVDVGECAKNVEYMMENCRKACGACNASTAYVPVTTTKDMETNLDKMWAALKEQSADPDQAKAKASGTGVVTKTETVKKDAAVVIPHQTGTQAGTLSGADKTVKAKVAQVVASAKAVLSPRILKAQPVKTVVESPVVEQDEQEAVVALTTPVAAVASPVVKKTRKELMVRCFRLTVNAEEVKECVKAAKDGLEYVTKAAKSPEDVVLNTRSEEDNSGTHADALNSGEGVARRDLEDLSLSTPAVAVVTPADDASSGKAPAVSTRLKGRLRKINPQGSFAKLTMWQALGLVVLVVGVVVVGVPRIARMRRRARSGMRTE